MASTGSFTAALAKSSAAFPPVEVSAKCEDPPLSLLLLRTRNRRTSFRSSNFIGAQATSRCQSFKESCVRGVKLTGGPADETCETCIQAKITRVPVPAERKSELAKKFGERVYAYTWSANSESLGGNKYATMWTDDTTRWTKLVPQKEKSQAFTHYKALEAEIETQEGHHIEELQTDNGGEFCSLEFG